MSDKPLIPSREPDHIWMTNANTAIYIWFDEMVLLSPHGFLLQLEYKDALYGQLFKNEWRKLPDSVQQAYAKWWYDIFESKFTSSE